MSAESTGVSLTMGPPLALWTRRWIHPPKQGFVILPNPPHIAGSELLVRLNSFKADDTRAAGARDALANYPLAQEKP